MRRWLGCAVVALMTGCAGQAVLPEREANTYNVDGRLLEQQDEGGAGAVQPYRLAPSERFRMPRPVHAPSPTLAAETLQSLPPTTVCMQVVLDAHGHVQRSEPLLTHPACAAGAEVANQWLVQAARQATEGWSFVPAALCHFAPGAMPSDDCSGATRIEDVPVTLAYAFTFEVVEGRTVVRSQSGVR